MPYNTVPAADTYFSERYGYLKWASLSDPIKTTALVSANQVLDLLCTWDGYKTDPDQENEFPRDGETEAPDDVKTAELEIAYLIVDTNSVETDAGDSLTELKAGSVNLKFRATSKAGNPLVNEITKKLLGPLGQCDFNMGSGSTTLIPSYRG